MKKIELAHEDNSDGTLSVPDGIQNGISRGLPPIKHDDIEISFDETGAIPLVRELITEDEHDRFIDMKPSPAIPIEDRPEYQKIQQERAVLADHLLRQKADFENFRKRQERDKSEFQAYANSQLILDLLPFLDNMERALEHVEHAGSAGFVEGIQLIYRQVLDVLVKHGVSPIDTKSAQFDPNIHQAIGFLETSSVLEGHVADEIQRGYMIRDRLLRPAIVRVAQAPVSSDDPATEIPVTKIK